jgi:hypothetical protein
MASGGLCVKVDGEFVPVARCSVDNRDGGVFVAHESDVKSGKKTISFHRIGTLPPETLAALKAHAAASPEPTEEAAA